MASGWEVSAAGAGAGFGQIDEGKFVSFFAKFSGILETQILEMESINQEFLEILERVTYMMSIYVVFLWLFGSQEMPEFWFPSYIIAWTFM